VLRKLLTKKRVEKKAVTFVRDTSNLKAARNDMYEETSKISIEELPVPTYEVLEEDREGMKKGNIIVTVAQKTAPMFAHFSMIALVQNADII
jgi:hypothetical protein